MGVRNARLVSVALLVVLLGTPAAAVACAFDCAGPAPGPPTRVTAQDGTGCHQAPPPSAAVQLDRGERDNCREHVLPEDGTAAVLTSAAAALSQPAALAVAPLAGSTAGLGTVLLATGTIRGPSIPPSTVARPPLVLRI